MFLKIFGKNPAGSELEKVRQSPNYVNGSFRNIMPTELMEGASMFSMMWKFMNKPKNTVPPKALPSVKTDLKTLPGEKPVIIWFGHSSYLIKINSKNILVDPVLSGEETAQASIDLETKVLMPVHWGKFSISLHPWDEPVRRLRIKANEIKRPGNNTDDR